ncbi:HelD family protein [Streptomyces sp. NPDC059786]|uniref:HelD family protein n=1 Tax=Streptomyces sp. NPDC059786 TaxID=3346946 RepID=UPI003652C292
MSKRARRSDVLAAEQKAVDHAYQCLERTRHEAAELKKVGAAASGKDAIDVNRSWRRELDSLDLGRNSLVFMRADVVDGTDRETFYIGRRAVFDAERNPAVISWSAPAAVRWRLTSEQDPGPVRLLRQIVCNERVVNRYFDLHGADDTGAGTKEAPRAGEHRERRKDAGHQRAPEPSPSRTAPPGTDSGRHADDTSAQTPDDGFAQTPAEEPDWRDPLLDELDRARDGAMHDIVETIRRDQLRLVTDDLSGVLIVQGGPGTGKTAVGMHRVSWLLDNGHMAADDVLVIGPNRAFLDYVGTALEELGTRGVTMLELPALWSATTAVPDPFGVAAVKADARMSAVLRRAVDDQTITTAERLEALVGGSVFTFELRRREVVVPVARVMDIAEAALAGDSPYRVRRERCTQRIVQYLTETYTGLLPGPADADYFSEIRRLRPVVRLLRRICPDLSARDVLRRLLTVPGALAAAAEGILTPQEQAVLTTPHETAPARTAWEPSREDLVCLDELEHVLSGRPERTYGHVVIDEAQDITPLQARSLARRCPSGSMTVLGDLAQATGPVGYEGWEQLGTALAGGGNWRMAELLTGFRVPGEIMEYVRPLGAHCAPGMAIPDSVRRTGTAVDVLPGPAPAERAAARALDITNAGEGAEAGRTTVIVVPQTAGWKETVAALVAGHDSISVLTPDDVKGLEFDHVIVVEPADIIADTPIGPRRLYVALTRCTQSLTVVHRRPLPRWIGGPANPAPTPKQLMAQVTKAKARTGKSGVCTRYRAEGTRCGNRTREPDGWCRQPGCGGFRTAEPVLVGKAFHLRVPKDAEKDARLELSPEQVAEIRISSAACGAFVARHRGSLGEAAVELHAMLAPFLDDGRHLRLPESGWLLDLHGYRLGLDADARTVTSYDALHAERSYAQFAAGVATRVGAEARAERRTALTVSVGEQGPDVADETTVRALVAADMHVSRAALIGYERIAKIYDKSDEDFLRLLRDELTTDLSSADVELLGGRIVVEGDRCQWWLRTDGRALTTVRKSGTEIYRGFADRQADEPMLEGGIMPVTSGDGDVLTAAPTAATGGDLADMVAERVRVTRRDRSHEALRHRLLADLYDSSDDVGDGEHVDAWSLGPDGMTLFDVLGEDESSYERIREAAVHLLEAAYLRPHGQAEHLVVVLREPPAETWITDVVDRAFGVELAWRNAAQWAGPAARRVMGVAADSGE